MDATPAGPPLSPTAALVLERARRFGLFLHAAELGLEHVFCALLDEEHNAACQALIAGFADPDSLRIEALATANGILVVASHTALPFSTLGVRALFEARRQAARRGETWISPARLALACLERVPPEFAERLRNLGCAPAALELHLPAGGEALELDSDESVFRRFDLEAKKLLAAAARAAQSGAEKSISPQRLLLAALSGSDTLAAEFAAAAQGARALPPALLADSSPAAERSLKHDPALAEYLSRLSAEAGTIDMLLAFFWPPETLIAQILARHKVQPEALTAARACFDDPGPG
jgi:ATP-dependent Clp protease ATP-binding subunit ClpA